MLAIFATIAKVIFIPISDKKYNGNNYKTLAMARVFKIIILKKKNIFFLLLIASALLYGQDNSVTVKLKDGREITGVKISGGIENYYISIMTDEGRVIFIQ